MGDLDLKIGIMGGTFDPIHYGHLVAAEEARIRFELSRVIFVPSGQPPHKKDYRVSHSEHRYAMTLLATCANPHFQVSRIEIGRPGASYAIDTLKQLRQQNPPGAKFFFITGADAILEILTWHQARDLVSLCEFIAATRPGYDLGELERALDAQLRVRVHPLAVPGIEISSTEIRERVRAGLPIKYLTPPSAEIYIMKNGLYRDEEEPQSSASPRTGEDLELSPKKGGE